jgi:hypothetical protein
VTNRYGECRITNSGGLKPASRAGFSVSSISMTIRWSNHWMRIVPRIALVTVVSVLVVRALIRLTGKCVQILIRILCGCVPCASLRTERYRHIPRERFQSGGLVPSKFGQFRSWRSSVTVLLSKSKVRIFKLLCVFARPQCSRRSLSEWVIIRRNSSPPKRAQMSDWRVVGLENLRESLEHGVTCVVPVGIVDFLERDPSQPSLPKEAEVMSGGGAEFT